MPSLTQLQYALAVEKLRHFGKAARACHVSQPTLSQQIQKMEDEMGIIIFDRIQKPVIATEAGTLFLKQAKIVIQEHERLLHQTQIGTLGVSGKFHLGIIPTVSSHLVPLFVGLFSKTYPRVELFIEEMKTETILNELKLDRLDGAVLATPLPEADFKIHPLYYEPFLLYLSRNHPLLAKKVLSPKDLDGSEMWLLQDGHCFKTQIVNFCSLPASSDGVLKNIHFQGGSLEVLRNLVQKSRGYTMIPELMSHSMSSHEQRDHVRPFRAPVPTREISFVYRRDHWKLEVISAIKKTIDQTLPQDLKRKQSSSQVVLEFC